MQTIIKFLADGTVIPIVIMAGYALLFRVPKSHRLEVYSRILVAGLTAYLMAKLIGAVYQPSAERPFEVMGVDPGASFLNNPGFPSDHALFTAFLTLAVWFETKQRKLAGIMGVLTLLVCLGRVLALVHTPIDVIGGLLVAGFGGLWFLQEKVATVTRQNVKKSVQ